MTVATPTKQVTSELDAKYAALVAAKDTWRDMPIKGKVQLLKDVKARLLDNMHSWGRAGAQVKGLANDPYTLAEQTFISPVLTDRYINTLIEVLETIDATGKPPQPPTRTLPSGQVVAKVFPLTEKDKKDATLAGFESEFYIQPGKPASQGAVYLGEKRGGGRVCAMLGAGNLGFLGLKDILYALFEQNDVVMFKPHPIQAPWHSFADYVLEPLAKADVYRSVYIQDVADTQQMLYHPAVECVHMTGGTVTHDAIVWGSDPKEQATRKAANDPLLKVPITSELGCITPWIVTPGSGTGSWTEEQLDLHALSAANGAFFNNGYACNSLKVMVIPENWSQADVFLSKVKDVIKKLKVQPAWYPGHNQRYDAWKATFPKSESLEAPVIPSSKDIPGAQPTPFLVNEIAFPEPGQELTPEQKYAFTVEPFVPVLTVVRVPAASTEEFMAKATDFSNNTLWGNLSCAVLLHPDTEKELPEASQKMLDSLEFGSVVVNAYSGSAYSTPHTQWGAFQGDQTLQDVKSGLGCINNTLMFDHPQKAVLRLPFTSASIPKPLSMMGLPAWAFAPLTGLIVGGVRGLLRAAFSRK